MNMRKKLPKTRYEYEFDLLCAFMYGMNAGYGVDHENIHEDENEAILEFAKDSGFKTDAVEKCLVNWNK